MRRTQLRSSLIVLVVAAACLSSAHVTNVNAQQRQFKTLTPERFDKLNSAYRSLAILFKMAPKALRSDNAFLYWIGLNDCAAAREHRNEFEWDSIRAFFERKTPSILNKLPDRIRASIYVKLGGYDRSQKSFPIIYSRGYGVSGISAPRTTVNRVLRGTLADAQDHRGCHGGFYSGPQLEVAIGTRLPNWIEVKEELAREFVKANSHSRTATMNLVIRLSSPHWSKSAIQRYGKNIPGYLFSGQIEFAAIQAKARQVLGRPVQHRYLGVAIGLKSPDIGRHLHGAWQFFGVHNWRFGPPEQLYPILPAKEFSRRRDKTEPLPDDEQAMADCWNSGRRDCDKHGGTGVIYKNGKRVRQLSPR